MAAMWGKARARGRYPLQGFPVKTSPAEATDEESIRQGVGGPSGEVPRPLRSGRGHDRGDARSAGPQRFLFPHFDGRAIFRLARERIDCIPPFSVGEGIPMYHSVWKLTALTAVVA